MKLFSDEIQKEIRLVLCQYGVRHTEYHSPTRVDVFLTHGSASANQIEKVLNDAGIEAAFTQMTIVGNHDIRKLPADQVIDFAMTTERDEIARVLFSVEFMFYSASDEEDERDMEAALERQDEEALLEWKTE